MCKNINLINVKSFVRAQINRVINFVAIKLENVEGINVPVNSDKSRQSLFVLLFFFF